MYRMLYNDSFLFDPFDETRIVSSASITTNVNAASYLDFTIAATHPLYDTIEQRSGTITLYSDNEKLFQGQITSIDMDMDGNKSVTCSSALDWLKDVQLRPYSTDQAECDEYEFKLDKAPDALDAYFQWLIDQYNAQNKDNRYFTINVNQAADLTNRNIVYFASTSPRSVADAIEEDILKTFGGYLVLRYEDDQLILDLYSDIHEMNEQIIDYGENILDISRNESTDDQYTAVYPIGATPQYTAKQQQYHDEKDAYDEYMKQREATEKAAIDKLKKEEDAEQERIKNMPKGKAKANAQDALRRRKDQRQLREQQFSDETKSLQDAQKIKDDENNADKTKPNPITIESLDNGGYPTDLDIFKEGDVVYSVSYVARYGYKEFVYSESDVHDKNELLKLAVAKLKTLMAPTLTIDVRAVDQALYNPKHRHLFAGQAVRVRSKAHNVDEFMMVSSIDLNLIDPSQTTATLGVAYDTLTGQQSSFLRNLNSKIVASVDAVDKLGEDVKVTEITLGKVETVVENTNNKADLIINTVDDYKWMTDTAWGKADDAQESADEANQGVTDTNVRIDNIKMATDERIDGMETDISSINTEISNTKAEVEQAKQTAEQIRQEAQTGIQEAKDKAEDVRTEAQTGIQEAKDKAEDVRTEANTAIDTVKTDLAATEAKAELARQNASSALGGLSSANAQINGLRIDVNRHQENITNIDGEIVGVKDTISGVAETANSALTVATTNTQAINEQSTRIDTAYSDIEATRTSVSEVKQTADGLKVNLETNYLDKDALGANYASKAELNATSESITSTVEKTYATKSALEGLQNIADAAIETWSGRAVPTVSNPPASTWTTDALKRQHSGDIYYDMDTGKSYRWGSEDGTAYSWSMIADNDITKAIADAAKAQQTADGAKQDVVNLSNDVEATYTSKSEFEQTSGEIRASVNEVASANETNAQKIAEVSVKADGISAKVEEQAETISGHATTIGQLSVKADGLQTKFEQVSDNLTELTDNLDGLINPSFASNSRYGWTINPTNNVRLSTFDTSVGGPYLVIDSPNPSPKLMTFINDGILTFTPGHTYRIHILTKTTDRRIFVEDEGLTIRLVKPGTTTWLTPYANIRKADYPTEFTTISRDITITEDAASAQLRLAFNAQSSGGSICIKSVAIEDITESAKALTKTSELEQNLNGFRQTVSETYTTKNEFDNLTIGGRNLLKDTKTPKQLVGNNGTNQCMDLYMLSAYSWARLEAGQYMLSVDIKYEGTISGKIGFMRNGTPWGFSPNAVINCTEQFTDAKRTAHFEFPIKNAYDGVTNQLRTRFDNVQGTVTFSNVKLERGTKATAWSPAPEDMLDAATASTTYTTKSEFTQTANEIKGKVEEQAETIDGHTNTIGTLSLKADKFETDISQVTDQTTAIAGRTTELEQNLDGFRQTVSETYTTKDETDAAINGIQIGGTNLSIANGYYNVSGLKNFTYTAADDQYDFDVSAASSGGWGHRMEPKNPCTENRRYPWGKWGTVTFDIYAERECTFVADINNKNADGSGSGNDNDLRGKAQKILPDGSIQPIANNSSTATHITIPAQQWVRIGIMCYNGNQGTNPNHADIQDHSSIGFLSLGEEFHVKVRKIKFEVGNKPTAWSPCPLDMLDKASAETTYTTKTEFTQTSSEIRGKVEEQAETIDGHTNSISTLSLKATKFETDISQTSDQVNGILDRTSTLEQDLGGFKQSVSNTYISKTDADKNLVDAINAMQIGGTNMLLDTQQFGQSNPNNVTSGRLININAMNDLQDGELANTKYSVGFKWRRIPGSNASNDPDGARYSVFVKKGGTYTLSFESWAGSFYVYFYGPNGYIKVVKTIVDGVEIPNSSNGDGKAEFPDIYGKWTRHTITWVLDDTGSTLEKYVLFRRKGSSGYVSVLAPKLEEGSKATEWSPSPFDTLLGSTIDKTYATKSLVEQTERSITSTVEQNYATKTQLTDEMKKSVKTIEIRGRQDGNYWLKLGRLTMPQQGKDFHIDYTGGRGFNGSTSQNSQLEIHVRSSNGGGNLFAVTVNRLFNADMHTVKAFAIDSTHIDLYMTGGGQYSTGTMAYYGQYTDFSGAKQIEDISTAEGTELTVLEQSLSTKTYVKQTAESVSIGVVEDFKDGKHGDKLTTQSNLTALKNEINASVSEQYADLSDQIKLANSDNAVGKNFSFESNNFEGWASHDNWTIDTNGAHTGRYYAQNTIPANSNGNQLISMGSIAAEYGHTYKLEYWAKKKPNTQCRGLHRISYKRSGVWEDIPSDVGTTIFLDENGTTNITGGRDYFDVTDSWMKVTTYIIPPSNVTDIRVRIIGNNPGSAETVFAVDDVSLTDYSVAKTINKTMAGINVKADSIVQEVRNDYATKDLVNRSIPGLKNPNFDVQKDGDYNTIAGWSILGPWAETRLGNSAPVSSSEGGTYFVGKSGTTAGQTLELINQGYISAYPGMKVQISWWMFVDANIIQNSNFSAGIIANNVVTRNLLSNYSTGGWKYMTTTVEVPANVNQFRVRFGFVTTGTSGWLRLDSVSVTDVTEARVALGKANTAVSTLDEFQRTVSNTYVDKNTLTQMQTQWDQTAQGFEASIKASNSSISVVNPGFETGDTTGWTATNFKNISVSDGSIFQNTTCRFLGYRNGNNMPKLENEGTVTARKNDYIKVSARILFLDGSNNSLGGSMRIGVKNSHSGIPYLGNMTIMSGGWNTVSYNVQATEDGSYSVWLDFPSTIAESTKILVDDVTMANETEAVHADSRINALETRIAMTSEGVRVGKIENGTFQGTSALMNSEGSFDILQGEEAVATLQSDYVGLMRNSDTDKYRFGVRPYKEHSTGSVDYTYEGVDLQTVGGFSLNGIPAAPASDILSIRPQGMTGNNYFIKYNVDTLKNDNAIFLNAAILHRDYYQRLDEGKPALAVHFKHAVGLTTTKDNDTDVSNDHIDTQVMAINPCLYGIQFVVNAQKNTANSYLDATVKVMKTGESTWINSSALPAFRVIEVGDPLGWLTRTSPMYFVKLDVGYRFGIYISGSSNDFKLGSLNKIIVTRMPFSGERMD